MSSRLRIPIFATALVLALVAATATAEGPAVESPNGKFAFDAGRVDGESLQLFDGSFAFPITEQFAGQLDGATGIFSGDDFAYALGGQFFWRDPELALVGVEAAYADRPEEDVAVRRFGAVTEFYRGSFTARGQAGYQNSDLGNGGYGSLDFTFYAGDDLALSLGGALAPGNKGDLLNMGVEYQPSLERLQGLSFFADGAVGQSNFESVQAGVRYYFDDQRRSLKNRQRRQDPDGIGSLIGSLEKKKDAPKSSCPPVMHDYDEDTDEDTDFPRFARVAVGPCSPPKPPPCTECT